MTTDTPPQRTATLADAPAIAALMRASVLELFPRFYDERQTASAADHIARLDLRLIEDGTYFVHEADGEIVACGGWSRRNKTHAGSRRRLGRRPAARSGHRTRSGARHVRPRRLDTPRSRARDPRVVPTAAKAEGFTSLTLTATLPGVPLYRSFGFTEVERVTVTTPDGVDVPGAVMARDIDEPDSIRT